MISMQCPLCDTKDKLIATYRESEVIQTSLIKAQECLIAALNHKIRELEKKV